MVIFCIFDTCSTNTVTAITLKSLQSEQMRQIKGKGLRQKLLAQGYTTCK